MPKPLSTRKRNAVLADIKAGGKSRNQIARDHGISAASVTNIAKAADIGNAFDRSQTEKGARARAADCKALRAQMKLDLMHDAEWIRLRLRKPCKVVVSTPDGAEVVELDEAPLADVRSGCTALGILVDKSIRLEQVDADGGGSDHAKSLLGKLFTGLASAVDGDIPAETPLDDSP